MQIKTFKTSIFKENEDLIKFILKYIKKVPNNSIIVITSKVVALSEGRTRVIKNQKEKIKLIKEESDFMLRTKYTWLTLKDDMVMASAGIDESNADGKVILLPKDSFKSALSIRKALKKKLGKRKLGQYKHVIELTDSFFEPLPDDILEPFNNPK